MRLTCLSAALALMPYVFAAPTKDSSHSFVNLPQGYANGFRNPTVQSSVGGKATCISGLVDVTASAQNVRVNLEEPANQTVVTEIVTEVVQVNSSIAKQVYGGMNTIRGTYSMYSQLCIPLSGLNPKALQLLIHGSGFDRTYWDAAPGYSYVDYAAEQGYATFLYDGIGVGLSSHPDAIQEVQFPLHVAIAHELVGLLRSGCISNTTFGHVVGVGHSRGSFSVYGVAVAHPTDFDALILTGFSSSFASMSIGTATFDLTIASENQPTRFADLSNGYLVVNSQPGIQAFFFRAPNFDPALLDLAVATKQTMTLGEVLPLYAPTPATNFTGPIDVVDGANDFPNCGGNCLYPHDIPAATKGDFFPNARNFSTYLAPDTGHGLNLHYTADAAYGQMHEFLRENGF